MEGKSRRQSIAADTQKETTFGGVAAQNLGTHRRLNQRVYTVGVNQRNTVIVLLLNTLKMLIFAKLLVFLLWSYFYMALPGGS